MFFATISKYLDGQKDGEIGLTPAQELRRIIDGKLISVVYQPIISLADGSVLGYEALSRGPRGSILETPDKLFPLASEQDLSWELEYLCREKALAGAQAIPADCMLFLNVDPKIINDPRFSKGHTMEMLELYHVNAAKLVIEITERTAIDDYKGFCRVLDNYVSQGYKIAIDDTGAGYSGLTMLAETHPYYIKVDMGLVRDIDKDATKQAVIKTLQEFSLITNSKIIAEGIETQDELTTLLEIGIPYGQGFFLARPAPEFPVPPQTVKSYIRKMAGRWKPERDIFENPISVGEIMRHDLPFPSTATGKEIFDHFYAHPALQGVTIVDGGKPVGLLMRNAMMSKLSAQYGMAVYMNRSVQSLMVKNPLVVEWNESLDQVARKAMHRGEDHLYDYIVVTRGGRYEGITTVKRILEKTTELEVELRKSMNAGIRQKSNEVI